MNMWRILIILSLLGIWGQAAGACPEAHVAPAAAQTAMEVAIPIVAEDFAVIGCEHHCESPAIVRSAQAVVSESGKSLIASYVEDAGASFLNSSNPTSVALAVHARASSFSARHPAQPPYLLASRLRQ